MAPIGGGPPVGSTGASFTGPAQQLEIIENHCYAYSGNITDAGTAGPNTTMLDFTTGPNYYVKGQFQWEPNEEGSVTIDIVVEFNGQRIYDAEFDAVPPGRGMWATPLRVIIPPNTHVVMKFGCALTMEACAQFTGKVYR
tara:strand:- start:186 stop:605 length:420 start_codon:yes stop_codon:yes gene_type:complete